MSDYISIEEKGVPINIPVLIKQVNERISFGCGYKSDTMSGIIELSYSNGSYKWDGGTFLMKVTHWKEIDPKDVKEYSHLL